MVLSFKKTIFLFLAIAVLIFLYIGPSNYQISKIDKEVDRLCSTDGGFHVYETVRLSPALFNQWGDPNIPFSKESKSADAEYELEIKFKNLEEKEMFAVARVRISRFQAKVIRNHDRKVLGEVVSYSRIGGDPIGPWHPSSYSGCSQGGGKELAKAVFLKGS